MRSLGAFFALLCAVVGSQGFNVRSQVQLSRAAFAASKLDARQQAEQHSSTLIPNGKSLRFHVIGDWGRQVIVMPKQVQMS